MRRRLSYKRPLVVDLNVVPYIDVMLVLLIIFMVTAPLLQQGVTVELPTAQAEALHHEALEPIVLSVNQKGLYYLNIAQKSQQPLEAEQIVVQVAHALKKHPKRPVAVKGDQHADYGMVVRAMVSLQHAGVPSVGLITEAPVK
jgi:biopolymer transport protein TolR